MTPANLHYGRAEAIMAARQTALDAAYAANPNRFVRKRPQPPSLPSTSWINRPDDQENPTQ